MVWEREKKKWNLSKLESGGQTSKENQWQVTDMKSVIGASLLSIYCQALKPTHQIIHFKSVWITRTESCFSFEWLLKLQSEQLTQKENKYVLLTK